MNARLHRAGERLDDIDGRQVALLRKDARRSNASLARDLNLSRPAVQARIARLERDGIILGHAATIAQAAVGGVLALVTLSISVRPCGLVTDRVASWPEIDRIYSIAGNDDAILVVSVPSAQALSQLADRRQSVEGIKAVRTTVVLSERAGGHAAAGGVGSESRPSR